MERALARNVEIDFKGMLHARFAGTHGGYPGPIELNTCHLRCFDVHQDVVPGDAAGDLAMKVDYHAK